VELSIQEFSKLDPESSFEKVKSMEVLHFLKNDHWEVAKILRVEFNEPNVSIEEIFRDRLIEAQILEQEREKKTAREIYTYFIKARPPLAIRRGPEPKAAEGYLSLPYVVKDGKVKITFLGNAKQMRGPIKVFEDIGIRYRVISLTDAKISPHSLISRLTEKQWNALITAYTLGYYDMPRKIGLMQLAKRFNLARSTLDKHLRKAEQRLLYHIMNESQSMQQGGEHIGVAITLLVFTFLQPVTALHFPLGEAQVETLLIKSVPQFGTFVLSFVVIGAVWIDYYEIFNDVRRYSRVLVRLNFIFLVFVVFILFSTVTLGGSTNS
jgi:hypothetical protein